MDSYDLWKTTPPDPTESRLYCERCGVDFYVGDEYYYINDERYCPDCARDWLEEQRVVIEEVDDGE